MFVRENDWVDNPGSSRAWDRVDIEVNAAPYIFKGFYGLYDGKEISTRRVSTVTVGFLLLDAERRRPVRNADVTIEVTDSEGTVVASGDARWRWFSYFYFWRLSGAAPGDYTITAHLDDGTSHSVNIVLTN